MNKQANETHHLGQSWRITIRADGSAAIAKDARQINLSRESMERLKEILKD